MQIASKPEFTKLLTTAMGAYGKSLPENAILNIWWDLLEPFPLTVVANAFTEYRHRESKFAPVPAAIEQLCRTSDGRPEVEEAWTTSLQAMDETETVVWTEEMEAAFWIAHPALELRDEVAARMAFKQAYTRLIAEARAVRKPVKWQVTPGKNQERHRIVYERAVELGRLPAPDPKSGLLLQGPEFPKNVSLEGLAMVKAELAKLKPGSEKAAIKREQERLKELDRKKEIAQQVANYKVSGRHKKGAAA